MKQKAVTGISMNDYSIGALEALSWALALLDKVHTDLLSYPL